MGRDFLIDFDQTPDNRFYLCRTCQAHIALSKDYHYNFTDNELTGGVFVNVVNVHTLGSEQDRRVGAHTVSDVYCNRCCNLLGIKFVEAVNIDGLVCNGDFLLRLTKLQKWNGNEIIDVDENVDDPDAAD